MIPLKLFSRNFDKTLAVITTKVICRLLDTSEYEWSRDQDCTR